MANIAEDVKAIIVEKLGVDPSEVKESASFQNDLGADSLDIVEPLSFQAWRSSAHLLFIYSYFK